MKSPGPDAVVKAGNVKFGWVAYDGAANGYTWAAYSDAACTAPDAGITPNSNTAVSGTTQTAAVTPGVHYWKVTINGGESMPCWKFTAQ